MSFVKKVAKTHLKAAKKIHKYTNPVTGPSNLVGKVIGGKTGKVIGNVGQALNPVGGALLLAKKLLKKKNTNVTKATKQQRRERIDATANKLGIRTPERQQLVNERRKKIDTADRERFKKNPNAMKRVDKQITKRNERLGRNDQTYKQQIQQSRGKGGGGRAANFAAMEAKKAAEAKQAKKDAKKNAAKEKFSKLRDAIKSKADKIRNR